MNRTRGTICVEEPYVLDRLTIQLMGYGMRCFTMVGWRPGPRITHRRFFWDGAQFDFPEYVRSGGAHWCQLCESMMVDTIDTRRFLYCPAFDWGRVSVLASHADHLGHGFILVASTFPMDMAQCHAENGKTLAKHQHMIDSCKLLAVCS